VNPSQGALYVATGDAYIAEAARSAASLKAHNPDLPVTLFADRQVADPVFDDVRLVAGRHARNLDKVMCVAQSPYDRTLYIDADTLVCGRLAPLLAVLDKVEWAHAHAPRRFRGHEVSVLGEWMSQLPDSLPMPNGGLLLFRRTAATQRILADWLELYQRDLARGESSGVSVGDQASLREALYRQPPPLYVLPPEYNCIVFMPGYLGQPAVIVHGRSPDLPAAAAALNALEGPRVHYRRGEHLEVINWHGESRRARLRAVDSTSRAERLVRVARERGLRVAAEWIRKWLRNKRR
jgi:hypothetical protein